MQTFRRVRKIAKSDY